MVFPVVIYGCWSWSIKKAEHWRIEAFELWFWKWLLRVLWTARRSNLSILKDISPGCSLDGLMLKLNLQYFGHLMQRVDPFGKTLMLGKIEGRQRRGWQRIRWLDGITDWMDMGLCRLWQLVMDREAMVCWGSWGCKELDTTERLNWTTPTPKNKQGKLFLASSCSSRCPNQALPEFLVWPLINFYWLWKVKTLVSINVKELNTFNAFL